MASRTVRRRRLKRLERVSGMSAAALRAASQSLLKDGRDEMRRRADSLKAPEVWAWEADHRELAWALDPSGELAGELACLCKEAVAGVAGLHLKGGSRPLADRARLERPQA